MFSGGGSCCVMGAEKGQKTMEEIERMLDAAMTGSFSETNFDESQLSALETKFAHYLSAAEASSQNIAQEKRQNQNLDCGHFPPDENADCKPAVIQRALMEETLPASAKANVEALYKQSEKLRFLIDSLAKLPDWKTGSFHLPQQAALQPLLESVVLPNQLLRRSTAASSHCPCAGGSTAIILADEPTGNLDSKTSQDVLSLLKVTSQKFAQTIVMITHNEEIAQMADRIIRIEDGRIVSQN